MYWNSYQLWIESRSPYIHLHLVFQDDQVSQEWILTVVPKHLERWTTTLVVGEDWISRKLRVVFVDDDGATGGHTGQARAEMKELPVNFSNFLLRFSKWRQEGPKARSLSITSTDDDNDDDDDDGTW